AVVASGRSRCHGARVARYPTRIAQAHVRHGDFTYVTADKKPSLGPPERRHAPPRGARAARDSIPSTHGPCAPNLARWQSPDEPRVRRVVVFASLTPSPVGRRRVSAFRLTRQEGEVTIRSSASIGRTVEPLERSAHSGIA